MPSKKNQKILKKSNLDLLPNFRIDKVPEIRLKSIRLQNFKVFDDYTFDFTDKESCKKFVCFVGFNGLGKSTILNSIQLLFTRFEGYDKTRMVSNLGKQVRHIDGKMNGVYGTDNFLITAKIESSSGDYELEIDKNGFIKDHPPEIKEIVYRLCYFTRLDQELHQFQLNRAKWPIFKKLFEAVTGFKIHETKTLFDQSGDPVQAELLKKYVLGFTVHKPREIIHHNECSDGEKKIIKSFSTMLNKEYAPQLILIDNVEMHVDRTRHIRFVQALQKCYPKSQIFSTTHSYYLSRNFGRRSQIYDLRIIYADPILKKEPWRFCIIDEVEDCLLKVQAMRKCKNRDSLMLEGKKILRLCVQPVNDLQLFGNRLKDFLSSVADNFVCDLLS